MKKLLYLLLLGVLVLVGCKTTSGQKLAQDYVGLARTIPIPVHYNMHTGKLATLNPQLQTAVAYNPNTGEPTIVVTGVLDYGFWATTPDLTDKTCVVLTWNGTIRLTRDMLSCPTNFQWWTYP